MGISCEVDWPNKIGKDKRNVSRKHERLIEDPDKLKVECICPKCGKKHILNFHWIGRGKPRKFCQNCRDHQDRSI
jgi:hypothetical protein